MPGKAKYCEHCKGYGGLYVQTIKRYGDDRIKERTPDKPVKENCLPCKGTGMISVETDKVPVFETADGVNATTITSGTVEATIVNKVLGTEEGALTSSDDEADTITDENEVEDKTTVQDAEDLLTEIREREAVAEREEQEEKEAELEGFDNHPVINEPENEDVTFEATPVEDDEEMGL